MLGTMRWQIADIENGGANPTLETLIRSDDISGLPSASFLRTSRANDSSEEPKKRNLQLEPNA